jgi:ABC-type antimicrobial peptide transport system permease subunit
MTFTVKTSRKPETLVPDVRQGVATVFPDLALANLITMEDVVAKAFARDRFSTLLLSLFGFVALVLATVGVYGVMAYSVEQRVRELGIRMALGATAGRVRAQVLREGVILVGIGLVLGVFGSLALGAILSSQLFGVSPRDPVVMAAVLLTLGVAGIVATGVPAQRATSIDALEAMRGE